MIVEFLEEYEDMFQSPDELLGHTDVVKHTIDLQGHPLSSKLIAEAEEDTRPEPY